jgi:hypothetical protein
MQPSNAQLLRRLIALRTAAAVLVAACTCACGIPPQSSTTALAPAQASAPANSSSSPTTSQTSSQNPAAGTSSPLPTPPAEAVVISNVEDTTGWNWCSDCAGGLNNTTDYWTAPFRATPSMDGFSREFYVGGPSWTAGLFYHTLWSYRGQFNYATHFLWDFWIYVDSSSMQHVWDLEYDLYQALNGYEYMMGTHCIFGSTQTGQVWEIYSQADHKWKATSVPCSRELMPPDKWHHIQWMLERDPNSHAYKFVTLVVNGTAYPLNITEYAAPIDWGDTLGVQWQIDTDAKGGSAHEWMDKCTVTIW